MIRRRKPLSEWQPQDKEFRHLPVFKIKWPSDTWLRRRLSYVRAEEVKNGGSHATSN